MVSVETWSYQPLGGFVGRGSRRAVEGQIQTQLRGMGDGKALLASLLCFLFNVQVAWNGQQAQLLKTPKKAEQLGATAPGSQQQ